ncbi:MAG: hypothetical protein K9J81_08860 [Desulfohalobiaceae bacterium]|nr:hypothetical protein [Desulfohalobiaceae bacterium]
MHFSNPIPDPIALKREIEASHLSWVLESAQRNSFIGCKQQSIPGEYMQL